MLGLLKSITFKVKTVVSKLLVNVGELGYI